MGIVELAGLLILGAGSKSFWLCIAHRRIYRHLRTGLSCGDKRINICPVLFSTEAPLVQDATGSRPYARRWISKHEALQDFSRKEEEVIVAPGT